MDTAAADPVQRPDKLSLKTKIGFGIGDLGGNLFFTIIGFYLLNYLTNSFGLAAAAAGTAVLVGKAWDAVTDPAVGFISDRTHTRWGRRRPYMAVGAVFLLILMVLMFSNPGITSDPGKFAWALVIYCLLNTAYTLVNIPYSSLTPELTSDFNERTTLNGYRMSFAVVGTFIGAGATLPLVEVFGGSPAGWPIVAAVMGAIMAASTFITVFTVRENPGVRVVENIRILRSYFEVVKQKPFLVILSTYALHMTGVAIVQATLLYYFQFIYNEEALFTFALMALLGAVLVFIPVWVRISRAIGKRAALNVGMGLFAAAVMTFFLVGHSLPVWFAFLIFGIAGIGYSTNYVLSWSLVPDVVEYDYAENGRRREGIFYGMWTFFSKLGSALGVGMSGWILGAMDFIEPARVDYVPVQPQSAILGIRLLSGPIPALFFLAGIVVLSFYPITKEVYEQILEKVKKREEEAGTKTD